MLFNQSRSAKPAGTITLSPSPADFRTSTAARSNLHSARQPSYPTSRAFLHWRLSDDGHGASRIVPGGRPPKPFTTGDIMPFYQIQLALHRDSRYHRST